MAYCAFCSLNQRYKVAFFFILTLIWSLKNYLNIFPITSFRLSQSSHIEYEVYRARSKRDNKVMSEIRCTKTQGMRVLASIFDNVRVLQISGGTADQILLL